jgi:hypothetical protein
VIGAKCSLRRTGAAGQDTGVWISDIHVFVPAAARLREAHAFEDERLRLAVTVLPGSTLATVPPSKAAILVQGVAALALQIFMQFVFRRLNVRSTAVRRSVTSEPTLLADRRPFAS